MFPFLDIESMSSEALIAATRAMLLVARADGLHDAEESLINTFYSGCATGYDWPSFESLLQESDSTVDAGLFDTEEARDMLLSLLVMTAFADGSFSEAEQAVVRRIAAELQLPEGRFDSICNAVKDHMLAQISHLPDAESVARVAHELS